MSTMGSSTSYVAELIEEHHEFTTIPYHLFDRDEFLNEVGDMTHAQFGWTFDEAAVYCPQMLAEQSSHLTHEDRSDYLRAILWMVDRLFVLIHDPNTETPPTLVECHNKVESDLYDLAPDSMALVSEIELHTLDHRDG